MQPSDLLVAAADRIRDLAAAATQGPWVAFDDGESKSIESRAPFQAKAAAARAVCTEASSANAAWIAALSPAVAPMIESWLRETASYFAEFGEYWVTVPEQARNALALARLICPELVEEDQ